jgi:hypothetical protein
VQRTSTACGEVASDEESERCLLLVGRLKVTTRERGVPFACW